MSKVRLLRELGRRFVRGGKLSLFLVIALGILACIPRTQTSITEIRAELLDTKSDMGRAGEMVYFFQLRYREDDGASMTIWLQVSQREWMLFRKNAQVCLTKTPYGFNLYGCRA